MKKLIIITAILLVAGIEISFSQDKIDPPSLDSLQTSNLVKRNNPGFILGWNWGSAGRKLDEALQINTYHNFPTNSPEIGDNLNIIKPLGHWARPIISGRNSDNYFNGHSIYLEPSITVNTTTDEAPQSCENNGGVFGFQFKNLNVGSTDDSCGSFVLYSNILLPNPIKVLGNIWRGDILRWLDYDGDHHGTKYYIGITNDTNLIQDEITELNDFNTYHPFNGKKYYLTINLKALDMNEVENHLNDVILKIKMPYVLTHFTDEGLQTIASQDTILTKFDSIPMQGFLDNYEIRSMDIVLKKF